MKDNNLMKYKEMKRRLMALVLASSTFISSVSLVGCSTIDNTSSDNSYGELLDRDNNFKRYFTSDWFCDIWVEDYNNMKLTGAMFELRDLNNNVIDSWTSSDVPYRITRIKEGKYTLVEVKAPDGYVTASGNYKYDIFVGENNFDIVAIKHVTNSNISNNIVNNVFTTGNKEYVKDELFVFKLRDSYINRMSDNDYLKYNNSKIDIDNIPKYLLLNGTEDEYIDAIPNGSVQYAFNDITSLNDSDLSLTKVSLICNKDGSYNTILYNTYLGITGNIYNDDMYMIPVQDLTKEEINELFKEYQDNESIINILNNNGIYQSNNKIKVLNK